MLFDDKFQPHTWAFALAHRFRDIVYFKIRDLKKYMSRSWRSAFAVAPRDGKCPTSYLMAIVIFALSLTFYEIFANKKRQKFDLEIEGQGHWVEKRNLRHSISIVRIHICEFYQNFS